LPRVCSLITANGMRLGVPAARDTSAARYAVVGIVQKEKILGGVNSARLFQIIGHL
jgi:hypothetical protein